MVPESDRGMQCGLKVPVQIEDRVVGAFSLLSRNPQAYSASDLLHAQQLANCLGHGLAYQRLAEQAREAGSDRQRSAEIESSAELLRTISGVLDIRTVFPRISEIARKMLPHDALAMVFVDQDRHFVRQAHAPDDFPDPPFVTHKTPLPRELIITDITTAPLPVFEPADAFAPVIAAGYHSFMSVRLPAREQVIELSFWSKGVGAFDQRDLPLARRIADYVALSVSHEQLVEAERQAAEAQARAERLEARVQLLSEELESKTQIRVVGESTEWREVLKKATRVAETDTTVLVTGESGTGKEVVARFIHRASARSRGPFVALNCAALPEQLLESELFGYERGAFTSAQQAKPGQIELAAGGVLFLDEVTEMSLAAQAKFLRVLQEREFQRLGATRILKANIRVIAATNRDLRKAVERGDFREDLFYRLKVFDIAIPPLRERTADILPLGEALLQDIGKSFGAAAGRPHAGRPGGAAPVPLARQRPRAPQRARARGHSVRRRAHSARSTSHSKPRASHRAPSPPTSAQSSARPSRRCCASAAGTGRAPPSASASHALSSISGCRSMGSRSRPTRKRLGTRTSNWRRRSVLRPRRQHDARELRVRRAIAAPARDQCEGAKERALHRQRRRTEHDHVAELPRSQGSCSGYGMPLPSVCPSRARPKKVSII